MSWNKHGNRLASCYLAVLHGLRRIKTATLAGVSRLQKVNVQWDVLKEVAKGPSYQE